jgi:hypothetical protein
MMVRVAETMRYSVVAPTLVGQHEIVAAIPKWVR